MYIAIKRYILLKKQWLIILYKNHNVTVFVARKKMNMF